MQNPITRIGFYKSKPINRVAVDVTVNPSESTKPKKKPKKKQPATKKKAKKKYVQCPACSARIVAERFEAHVASRHGRK